MGITTRQTIKKFATLIGATALLAGCLTTERALLSFSNEEEEKFLVDIPGSLQDDFRRALNAGPHNSVLHYMHVGTKAFEMKEWHASKVAFDHVLTQVETIHAQDKFAEEARSNFTAEDYKNFLGEPHERMMAYYYRGLLYFNEGDFENARASFRSGLLQDSFTLDKDDAQDSILLHYLIGWASKCNGDIETANEAFTEAREHSNKKFNYSLLPPPASDANILAIAELGMGPRKITGGEYNEKLRFARDRRHKERNAFFTIDRHIFATENYEDLFIQALDRGTRQFDELLDEKAEFKEKTDTIGDRLLNASATSAVKLSIDKQHNQSSEAILAQAVFTGITLVAGIMVKGISSAVAPEADIRSWRNLPNLINLTTFKYKDIDAAKTITATYSASFDIENTKFSRPATVLGPENCKIIWASSRSKSLIYTKDY